MQRERIRLGHETYGVVVRPAGPGREPQMLLFYGDDSDTLRVLEGDGSIAMPFDLGFRLQLIEAGTGQAFDWRDGNMPNPVYDSATDAVYFKHSRGLMRLDADNTVSPVAREATLLGCMGSAARLENISSLAADGRGSLYMIDRGDIIFCRPAPSGSREGEGSQAVVIRPNGGPSGYRFHHLTCRVSDDSSGGQELIAATLTAVYRLAVTEAPGGGPPRLAVPVPLAGGREYDSETSCDGIGSAARCKSVDSMLLSPDGCSAVILDCGRLCKLDLATGAVTTLATIDGFVNMWTHMAWLPGGYIVVCCGQEKILHILHIARLGQSAAPVFSVAAGPSLCKRSLADLLERSGSGPAFVSLRLGPKVYDVPRAVLVERSAYFRRLLDGGQTEVELADTNPAAFATLLEYMFSGSLGELPQAQLRSTAELAKRLQLDGALEELKRRLLVASTSDKLVSDFLWAERQSLQPLAAALKERLLKQPKAVMATTPEEVVLELAARNPLLVAQIFKEAGSRLQR